MYINFFAFLLKKPFFLKNFVKIIVYNLIITDKGGPYGRGAQNDDKNKTRLDLIRTSLKISSMNVYKLLSDFKSLCKIFATVCWQNFEKHLFL